MLSADDIKSMLGLVPLPEEGGYYRETYRSGVSVPADHLPAAYAGTRCLGTAIYYLLTPEETSALHRLPSDEVFHFYLGDPAEMLQLHPDGTTRRVVIGSDLAAGQVPQVVVPGGIWQGMRLLPGGRYALMGTTVAPGFEFADYTTGDRAALISAYPREADLITQLTAG